MKCRGSVRGRADAGMGSGPGVERVITVSPPQGRALRPGRAGPCLSLGVQSRGIKGGAEEGAGQDSAMLSAAELTADIVAANASLGALVQQQAEVTE